MGLLPGSEEQGMGYYSIGAASQGLDARRKLGQYSRKKIQVPARAVRGSGLFRRSFARFEKIALEADKNAILHIFHVVRGVKDNRRG